MQPSRHQGSVIIIRLRARRVCLGLHVRMLSLSLRAEQCHPPSPAGVWEQGWSACFSLSWIWKGKTSCSAVPYTSAFRSHPPSRAFLNIFATAHSCLWAPITCVHVTACKPLLHFYKRQQKKHQCEQAPYKSIGFLLFCILVQPVSKYHGKKGLCVGKQVHKFHGIVSQIREVLNSKKWPSQEGGTNLRGLKRLILNKSV